VKIGTHLDEKGDIATPASESEFVAGQPVHLVTELDGAPSNTPVTVVWYGPTDQPVREETNWTREVEQALSFTASDTSAWKAGDYRAELWIANYRVKQEPFKIWKREPGCDPKPRGRPLQRHRAVLGPLLAGARRDRGARSAQRPLRRPAREAERSSGELDRARAQGLEQM